MQKKLFILITLFTVEILKQAQAENTNFGSISFVSTSTFTKSHDLNSLYAVGSSDYKIYRLNYTRNLTVSSFNYNISTTHTKAVRVIAVSNSERYVATGSEDFTIQVVEAYPRIKVCSFTVYNQLRSIVFHPLYEEIFYAASVDDAIRKYNITNCSKLVEKAVGGSVHSMIMNQKGDYLAYGTYQGHVGKIDEHLSAYSLSSNAHYLTVLFMLKTYPDYYLSIGDDNKVVLWNAGTKITSFSAISPNKLRFCGIFEQFVENDLHRLFGCVDTSSVCLSLLTTNTTINRFTNHACSSSSANWVDFRRLSNNEQVWTIQNGTGLTNHKVYEETGSLCNSGTWHSTNNIVENRCQFCGFNYPGCHFCRNGACDTCGLGTFANGIYCTNCALGCSDCNSLTSCNRCSPGYQPAGINCNALTTQPGCFYMSSTSKCSRPGNGYYVDGSNNSIACNSTIAGCMQCTSSSNCQTCKLGYYISSNRCTACNSTMPGCLICTVGTTCIKCSVAFKPNGANNNCSSCYGTCQTCGPNYDNCITCYPAQNRTLSGTSCNCKDGYYDISATGNYTCPLCSSVLTNCYLCTIATVCTQCQSNYYLYTSAGKTQCDVCSKYCQTCSGTTTNCTSCNADTYNRILSGSTCSCLPSYVSVTGSVACLPCGKLIDGCLDCTNQTYCTSCDTGYYLKALSVSNRTCVTCPYYCPSCSVNGAGTVICSSCPAGTHRTLTSGDCPCDTGYFDDNRTLICQKCSDVLSNCLDCQNRTKCTSCAPGMYTDSSQSLCAACQSTCLTCGAYFDVCATCDPGSNRVISGGKCVCLSSTYEDNGVCELCSTAIKNCNSCQNPYICTGCQTGFTLKDDLKQCIDCRGSINGCDTCTSTTNCTTCLSPFTLIYHRCRCPLDQYTSTDLWGQCKSYPVSGLKSSLGVQIEAHQHQNNTLIVFIRFRAKTLYVLNQQINDSISLAINGAPCTINFDYIDNNRIKISTELTQSYEKPNITVSFSSDVFYNQDLLTLDTLEQTVTPVRLYLYQDSPKATYSSIKEVLVHIFSIFKWIFFGFSMVGQGHLLFPFVTFIQLMSLFLMLKMSLPANLSMVLDGMLSFQVKSVIPLFNIKSNFFVIFPPMTYDYYGLLDFLLFGKIGDMLLIILVNVMTKFDEGIVRMFPPGRIRRYLYQSLVRRGYSVMSLCILSFQPSLILLSGVYITYNQWQSSEEIFNYCSCVFAFGFYLAYNFNHASNLQGTKLMKNIQNQQCFLGINSQQPTAARTTLIVLATDFWIIGSLHLVSPMIYFLTSILFLVIRVLIHLKRDYYIGKIHFTLRTFSNLFLLAIFCVMFVFYLGEKQIYIGFEMADKLGIVVTTFIFAYLLFHIVEKVLYHFKLESDYLQNKVVEGQNGEKIVVVDAKGAQNAGEVPKQNDDNQSSRSHKMKQFFNNVSQNPSNQFSGLNFRKRNENKQNKQNKDESSQQGDGMDNNSYGPSFNNDHKNERQRNPNKSDAFFKNSIDRKDKQKHSRIKSANTSKYAKNHLELRYKAQGILTKDPARFQQN